MNGRNLNLCSAIVSRHRRETIAIKTSYVFFDFFFVASSLHTHHTFEPYRLHESSAKKSMGIVRSPTSPTVSVRRPSPPPITIPTPPCRRTAPYRRLSWIPGSLTSHLVPSRCPKPKSRALCSHTRIMTRYNARFPLDSFEIYRDRICDPTDIPRRPSVVNRWI